MTSGCMPLGGNSKTGSYLGLFHGGSMGELTKCGCGGCKTSNTVCPRKKETQIRVQNFWTQLTDLHKCCLLF